MAKYTRKQAMRGIRFWKKALNEAIAAESEEDQKEEAAAEDGEDTGAEEDAGSEETGDTEGTDDPSAKIAELEARIAELEAKLGGGEAAGEDDFGSEEATDDEGSDGEESGSDDEGSDDEGSEGSDDEGSDDEESDDGSEDEELDESLKSKKYAPNTVGAVIQLLEKFDPKSKLMIRMNPGKYTCMPIDVSGKLMIKGHGCTYMDIARGIPRSGVNESKTVKKPAKRTVKKAVRKPMKKTAKKPAKK